MLTHTLPTPAPTAAPDYDARVAHARADITTLTRDAIGTGTVAPAADTGRRQAVLDAQNYVIGTAFTILLPGAPIVGAVLGLATSLAGPGDASSAIFSTLFGILAGLLFGALGTAATAIAVCEAPRFLSSRNAELAALTAREALVPAVAAVAYDSVLTSAKVLRDLDAPADALAWADAAVHAAEARVLALAEAYTAAGRPAAFPHPFTDQLTDLAVDALTLANLARDRHAAIDEAGVLPTLPGDVAALAGDMGAELVAVRAALS